MPTQTASLPSGRILFGEDAGFVLHCCEQLKELLTELERVKGERDAMLDLLRSDQMLTAIVRMINPAVFGTTPINVLGHETPNRTGLLESAKFLHSLRGSDADFEDEHKWLLDLVKTHPNFKDATAIAAQGEQ